MPPLCWFCGSAIRISTRDAVASVGVVELAVHSRSVLTLLIQFCGSVPGIGSDAAVSGCL